MSSLNSLDLNLEESLNLIKQYAIQRFREKTVARQITPVVSIKDYEGTVSWNCIPVIHKEMNIGEGDIESHLNEAVDLVRESEDKLMIVGEHEGWQALETQGLATADGRHVMPSCGQYPENIIDDIIQARRRLKDAGHPFGVLIVNSDVDQALERTYWTPDTGEPLTYKNYLLKEGLVEHVFCYPDLCDVKGNKTNMLLVYPSRESFIWIQDLPFDIHYWKTSEGEVLTCREAGVPKILDPTSIVEITDITP